MRTDADLQMPEDENEQIETTKDKKTTSKGNNIFFIFIKYYFFIFLISLVTGDTSIIERYLFHSRKIFTINRKLDTILVILNDQNPSEPQNLFHLLPDFPINNKENFEYCVTNCMLIRKCEHNL